MVCDDGYVQASRWTVSEEKKKRGFAAMDPKKVAEIASKGGKAAHAAGTAHQFSSEEARTAGKKGGTAAHVRRGRGPLHSETVPAAEQANDAVQAAKSA